MIKYTPSNHLSLENFKHPFHQQLDPNNRWVQLAELVPWDELAGIYAKHLDPGAGRESVDLRMVIGALIIKHKLSLTDRDTVLMISENIQTGFLHRKELSLYTSAVTGEKRPFLTSPGFHHRLSW